MANKTSSFYIDRKAKEGFDDNDDGGNVDRHEQSQPGRPLIYVISRERLIEFMDFPLQPFVASKGATRSTTSRKPRFFDLHLYSDPQLRKIVVVQNLPERVASICNDFLASHIIHIKTEGDFPFDVPVRRRRGLRTGKKDIVANESTLAMSYQTRFGLALSTVTSTLVFKRPAWETVFDFSLFPREKGRTHHYAIPDGFLCVTQEDDDDVLKTMLSLSEDDQKDINMIIKHDLHHLALWEFKSLAAGSKNTLDKFIKLEGDFTWPSCDRRGKNHCKDKRHETEGEEICVTGRKIGFDAREVDIISAIYLTPGRQSNSKGLSLSTADPKAGLSGAAADPEAGPSSSAAHFTKGVPMEMDDEKTSCDSGMEEDVSSDTDMASTPKQEATGATLASKQTSVISKAARNKTATKRKSVVAGLAGPSRAKDTKTKIKAKESDKKSQHGGKPITTQKSKDMAVQLWSEWVKYDATVIILNAGNYEIICICCRATNTLYISRVLGVEEVIYKRVQVGLQALAYYDARDRARQLEALETAQNPIFPRFYYYPIHLDACPPVHKDAASLSQSKAASPLYEDLLEDLRLKGQFNMLLRSISAKKIDYELCTMTRLSSSSQLEPSVSNWLLELADKITGRVYSVVAKNRNASFSDKLVIKLAENNFEYDQLKYEYKTHLRFQTESFGIKVFGVIQVPDSKIRGLLMVRSGFPPEQLRKRKKLPAAKKTSSHRENYLKAIEALHAHNFLHGNLKAEHFLMTDAGRVSLISYKPIRLIGTASEIDMDKGKAAENEDEYERLAKEFAIRMEGEKELAKNLSLA